MSHHLKYEAINSTASLCHRITAPPPKSLKNAPKCEIPEITSFTNLIYYQNKCSVVKKKTWKSQNIGTSSESGLTCQHSAFLGLHFNLVSTISDDCQVSPALFRWFVSQGGQKCGRAQAGSVPKCTCLAGVGICDHPQAWSPAVRWPMLEAATHFPSIVLGGSLIPIVSYRDGDGFSWAKHVRRNCGTGPELIQILILFAT